jgi:hypothetical protein
MAKTELGGREMGGTKCWDRRERQWLPIGPQRRIWVRVAVAGLGRLVGPSREKRKLDFFIHFLMNIEVDIKSKKIGRSVRKILNVFGERLGHLEQL